MPMHRRDFLKQGSIALATPLFSSAFPSTALGGFDADRSPRSDRDRDVELPTPACRGPESEDARARAGGHDGARRAEVRQRRARAAPARDHHQPPRRANRRVRGEGPCGGRPGRREVHQLPARRADVRVGSGGPREVHRGHQGRHADRRCARRAVGSRRRGRQDGRTAGPRDHRGFVQAARGLREHDWRDADARESRRAQHGPGHARDDHEGGRSARSRHRGLGQPASREPGAADRGHPQAASLHRPRLREGRSLRRGLPSGLRRRRSSCAWSRRAGIGASTRSRSRTPRPTSCAVRSSPRRRSPRTSRADRP